MNFKLWLEAKWKSLLGGRQKEFPFTHEPGVQRKAGEFVDPNVIDPEMEEAPPEEQNLYHVTTAIDAVRQSGRLKSRRELGGKVGLGGGPMSEAPDLISVTYDWYRAQQIYEEIKFVAELVQGQVPASTVWDSMLGRIDPHDEELEGELFGILEDYGLPKSVIEKIEWGDSSLINQYIKTPKQIYSLFQELETTITSSEGGDQPAYEMGVIGFTGSFEQMREIDPSQVAIIQVAARKDAQPEHIPYEKELRFRPENLWIVRYLQP